MKFEIVEIVSQEKQNKYLKCRNKKSVVSDLSSADQFSLGSVVLADVIGKVYFLVMIFPNNWLDRYWYLFHLADISLGLTFTNEIEQAVS